MRLDDGSDGQTAGHKVSRIKAQNVSVLFMVLVLWYKGGIRFIYIGKRNEVMEENYYKLELFEVVKVWKGSSLYF